MAVADRSLRKPDKSGEDPGAGVRGKPYEEMPHEVEWLLRPVEGFKPVDLHQEVVDELCHPHQPLAAVLRHKDILMPEFQHLVRLDEILAVDIVDVTEFAEPINRDADLIGPEMGQGKIDHIVADGAVLEDIKIL